MDEMYTSTLMLCHAFFEQLIGSHNIFSYHFSRSGAGKKNKGKLSLNSLVRLVRLVHTTFSSISH